MQKNIAHTQLKLPSQAMDDPDAKPEPAVYYTESLLNST
jgi:hypothetical protein